LLWPIEELSSRQISVLTVQLFILQPSPAQDLPDNRLCPSSHVLTDESADFFVPAVDSLKQKARQGGKQEFVFPQIGQKSC